MKEADDPKLADLKKLLKRLEKIDPETRARASPADGPESAGTAARRSPDAILERPANDAAPADGLLQLTPRNGSGATRNRDAAPSELPVIVKQSLPAIVNTSNDAGTFHVVIIASITAAIVSALATAGTVYWLNLESNRLAYEAPAGPARQVAMEAPAQPAQPTPAVETARHATATMPATPPDATSNAADVDDNGAARHASREMPEPPNTQATTPTPTQPAPGTGSEIAAAGRQNEIDLAATATPGSSPADTPASSQASDYGGITPPRPQPAGVPSVAGEDASTPAGPATTNTAESNPPALDRDNVSGSGQDFGPAQPAVAIASARELVAALTSSNAVAAESKTPSQLEETKPAAGFLGAATLIGPGERAALSSLAERETLDTRAETKAPTVAVYEAPPETAPVEAVQGVPADGATIANDELEAVPSQQKDANSNTQMPPAPQLSPGQVALSHPAEVRMQPGQPIDFPLAVHGTDEELRGHYLILSGLKRGAQPSTGSELMFDTWRINVADLPGLKLSVPAGFARRMHLAAELRQPDGATREKTTFVIAMPGAASSIVPETEEAAGLPGSVLRGVDDGEVQIDNGSLRAARLLFERAAEAGSARAAMLLAATFDANYLAAFKTLTPPVPDNSEARRWYKRATELGAPGARERLQRMSGI